MPPKKKKSAEPVKPVEIELSQDSSGNPLRVGDRVVIKGTVRKINEIQGYLGDNKELSKIHEVEVGIASLSPSTEEYFILVHNKQVKRENV